MKLLTSSSTWEPHSGEVSPFSSLLPMPTPSPPRTFSNSSPQTQHICPVTSGTIRMTGVDTKEREVPQGQKEPTVPSKKYEYILVSIYLELNIFSIVHFFFFFWKTYNLCVSHRATHYSISTLTHLNALTPHTYQPIWILSSLALPFKKKSISYHEHFALQQMDSAYGS